MTITDFDLTIDEIDYHPSYTNVLVIVPETIDLDDVEVVVEFADATIRATDNGMSTEDVYATDPTTILVRFAR